MGNMEFSYISNGELVVPSSDGKTSITKMLGYNNFIGRSCPLSFDMDKPFWDSLPGTVVGKEEKYVYMTFEAVEAAIKAIPFCIPVICLDACSIRSAHTEGVMLAATVATTEMKLLTVCIGTALGEVNDAWDFFLTNFREALRRYCPEFLKSKLVFMSDRHKGLLKGVKTRLPNAHHFFCILHIIRNLRNLKGKRHSLWKAAEADSECEFIFHFKNFLLKCSKTQELYEHRGSWSRYAILEKCRRYGVRTNNWAEIQNNAMKFLRGGSVLTVLHKFFLYTSEKVREYHTRAETL